MTGMWRNIPTAGQNRDDGSKRCQRNLSGHETADGCRWRSTNRHDSSAAAFWTFWLNYGILKLKGNRIRHNPKYSVKIYWSCGL